MVARSRRAQYPAAMRRLLAAALFAACSASAPGDTDSAAVTSTGVTTTTGATDSETAPTTGTASTTGDASAWEIGLQLGGERGALLSVWGPAPDEVYAVGGQLRSPTDSSGALYRFDGAAWSEQPLPDGTPMLHWIFGVDGDLWTVGRDGAALRREGDGWVTHPTGVDTILWGIWGPGRDQLWTADLADLISVWGRGPGEHLAVGGRANGRVARWDGSSWSGETFSVPGLSGVWMDPSGAATVVGMQGSIASLAPGSMELEPQESPTLLLLHAVFGFVDGPRFAVGGSLAGPPPYVGVIVQSLP